MWDIDCRLCKRRHPVDGRAVVAFSGSRRKRWSVDGWQRAYHGVLVPVVRHLHDLYGEGVVFKVGDANGVDEAIRELAPQLSICHEVLYANWRRLGNQAGWERNGRVLDGASFLIAVSAPSPYTSAGTLDAVRQARGRGIPVFEWRGRWLRE